MKDTKQHRHGISVAQCLAILFSFLLGVAASIYVDQELKSTSDTVFAQAESPER